VASNTSKTARASVRAGQAGAAAGALSVLGEFKYLIPLNHGKNAYVRNLTNGKTVHHRTDSDGFIEEIRRRLGRDREAPRRGRRLRGLSTARKPAPRGGLQCVRYTVASGVRHTTGPDRNPGVPAP